MNLNLSDWLNLALRWTHLVAGISWIGSSFYFMWLDSALTPPTPGQSGKEDVEGELWMVHSGGFYQVERKRISPGSMPKVLHWFKWEAAFTWMSGITLLSLVYYMSGGVYLLDPAVSQISQTTAVLIGLGLLTSSWIVYDLIMQSRLAKNPRLTSLVFFALIVGVAYELSHYLSGRAVYIHIGAMFGTVMVANVWVRILPAQQKMVDATKAGQKPDFDLSAQAKHRSVHNSYMTFPVLFIMLSNHYPNTYGHPLNWLVLAMMIVIGAGIRHTMIAKNGSGKWAFAPVAVLLVAVIYMTATPLSPQTSQAPQSPQAPRGQAVSATEAGTRVPFEKARAIIQSRCVQCHSAHPTDDIFKVAPNGVMFDTPEKIKIMSSRIRERAVILKTMPLANKTGITEEERTLLGRWIDQGANI